MSLSIFVNFFSFANKLCGLFDFLCRESTLLFLFKPDACILSREFGPFFNEKISFPFDIIVLTVVKESI